MTSAFQFPQFPQIEVVVVLLLQRRDGFALSKHCLLGRLDVCFAGHIQFEVHNLGCIAFVFSSDFALIAERYLEVAWLFVQVLKGIESSQQVGSRDGVDDLVVSFTHLIIKIISLR